MNLETWMTNLPEALVDAPLTSLAIPGSHDSGSFALDEAGPFAPDYKGALRIISQLFPCMSKQIVKRWSETQELDVIAQLHAGIRYLDIRVGEKPGKPHNHYHYVHALYGIEVRELAANVDEFLAANPKEVVLVDLNHFYGMDLSDHQRLTQSLIEIFGAKLAPCDQESPEVPLTLRRCWENKWQVIVFYQHAVAHHLPHALWTHKHIYAPWANTPVLTALLNFLTHKYHHHVEQEQLPNWPKNRFFVTQGVVTPNAAMIFENVRVGLSRFSIATTKAVIEWCEQFQPNSFNIVICDFVNTQHFCQRVVELNKSKCPQQQASL